MAKPTFFIGVFDHDRKEFSVHGPMADDTNITARVVAAQAAGRKVNCSADHAATKMATAIANFQRAKPTYALVAAVV